MEVLAPCGKSGDWEIAEFTISEERAALINVRATGLTYIPPGTYKRLIYDGRVCVMSNTPFEIYTHREFFDNAKGSVLINGLGLGMALGHILKYTGERRIEHVTVVELSKDVINLVAPSFYHDKRVEIINADALTWNPPKGERYNAVWHDIWPDINEDNRRDMMRLVRKYGKRADWQGCWSRKVLEEIIMKGHRI